MGCSANVISVDLAKQLLQNQPGARALVVSTEIITPNLYLGNDKSMLVQNTLFRAGGAALVLTSNRRDIPRAKYELLFSGRAQVSDDAAYGAVFQHEDSEGHRGVALSKDIVKVAGRAMKTQFSQLGKFILPFSEQAKVGLNIILSEVVKRANLAGFTDAKPPAPYVPDFSKAVEHFCIHAGGRAIIDGIQKHLGLADKHVEASRQTLYDWGNTSSSSIWYEMEWLSVLATCAEAIRRCSLPSAVVSNAILQYGESSAWTRRSAVCQSSRQRSRRRKRYRVRLMSLHALFR